MSEQEPTAAPKDENLRFISFHHNLYPKIMLPEIDMNNYRINRIMDQYKYLDEERKTRNILKNKYRKLSNASLGTEFLITVSELGMVVTSIALPVIIPVSVIISVALHILFNAFKINKWINNKRKLNSDLTTYFLFIYLSGLVTAVAVFRNPNTIPFCLTTDLLLNILFSWLLVHLPSTFFLDVLFFFFPLVSTP